ncbi:MAG: hypothetical protein KAV18_05990, partial [Candidatus Omnitrophica bacterium]|nr:hypothetical protein [Candidatus Omnitrophota bacterium]
MNTEKSDILIGRMIAGRYEKLEFEQRDSAWSGYEDRVMAEIARRKQNPVPKHGFSFLDRIIELKNTWELDPVHQRLEHIAAELVTAALMISGVFTYLVNNNLNYSLPTYLY